MVKSISLKNALKIEGNKAVNQDRSELGSSDLGG
jgi:hypothetical protein